MNITFQRFIDALKILSGAPYYFVGKPSEEAQTEYGLLLMGAKPGLLCK